jgi:hypothetical protein
VVRPSAEPDSTVTGAYESSEEPVADVTNVPSASTTFVLDTTQPTPARQTAPMRSSRDYHTLTSLPDGAAPHDHLSFGDHLVRREHVRGDSRHHGDRLGLLHPDRSVTHAFNGVPSVAKIMRIP